MHFKPEHIQALINIHILAEERINIDRFQLCLINEILKIQLNYCAINKDKLSDDSSSHLSAPRRPIRVDRFRQSKTKIVRVQSA